MKAIVVTALGEVDKLKMQDMPDPVPGPKDVLIEVHACGLNPVDYKVRMSGLRVEREFPFILGYDVSGVIKAMGKEVEHFKIGDEVYGAPSIARNGSNAELVCVDYRVLARKPKSIDHVTAAALPVAVVTAWEALHKRAQIHPDETVLIHAGAGGVGHLAIQLAKLHGCWVMTTAGREESINYCRELGADVIIDYTKEDFVARVNEETQNAGCNVVFETVGGPNFVKSLDCVAVNGRLVTITGGDTSTVVDKLYLKNASLMYEFMGTPGFYGINPEGQSEILSTVGELLEAGKLKPHVSQVISLEDIPEAHRSLEGRHVMGKIVAKVK